MQVDFKDVIRGHRSGRELLTTIDGEIKSDGLRVTSPPPSNRGNEIWVEDPNTGKFQKVSGNAFRQADTEESKRRTAKEKEDAELKPFTRNIENVFESLTSIAQGFLGGVQLCLLLVVSSYTDDELLNEFVSIATNLRILVYALALLSWIGAANQFVNELKDPFRWRRWRLPRRLQSIIPFLCYSLILTLHFAVSREEAAWALRQRRILVDGIPAAQLTEPKYPAAQVNVGAWKAIQVVNFLLSAIGWFVVAYTMKIRVAKALEIIRHEAKMVHGPQPIGTATPRSDAALKT